MKEVYIHGYFHCPKLGLLLKTEDDDLVAERMRNSIVQQLKEMPLEKFKKFCTFEKREIIVSKEIRSPINRQEYESDFKKT